MPAFRILPYIVLPVAIHIGLYPIVGYEKIIAVEGMSQLPVVEMLIGIYNRVFLFTRSANAFTLS